MTITLEQINASQEMPESIGLVDEMIHRLMPAIIRGGLFFEFGVWYGNSIKKIRKEMTSRGIHCPIYGFDSFNGLPEAWETMPEGSFNLGGEPPELNDVGIVLIPGLFQDTLETFLDHHLGYASFIHIDSDVYSSAKYVLTTMRDRIVPGTVIVFDEMINVDNYEDHEFKAFNEFLTEQGKQAQAICHGKYQVAFRIK